MPTFTHATGLRPAGQLGNLFGGNTPGTPGLIPIPPTISISSPADGAEYTQGDRPNVTAAVVPAAGTPVTRLDFLLDGAVFASSLPDAPTVTLPPLDAGSHQLAVSAVAGGRAYASSPVHIYAHAPSSPQDTAAIEQARRDADAARAALAAQQSQTNAQLAAQSAASTRTLWLVGGGAVLLAGAAYLLARTPKRGGR